VTINTKIYFFFEPNLTEVGSDQVLTMRLKAVKRVFRIQVCFEGR
jgi:hypothetical protein